MLNLMVCTVSLKKYAHCLNNGLKLCLSGTPIFSIEKEKDTACTQLIERISTYNT